MDDLKDRVRAFYEQGLNRADTDAMLAMMTDDVRWFSVDSDFNRTWYEGKADVRRFTSAFHERATHFTFTLHHVFADPDVPGSVVAEWTNGGEMEGGSEYQNLGITVFVFALHNRKIREVRQYFDAAPLMKWRAWQTHV